jgi:hypothetical protein
MPRHGLLVPIGSYWGLAREWMEDQIGKEGWLADGEILGREQE